jgi:hypothetical protein
MSNQHDEDTESAQRHYQAQNIENSWMTLPRVIALVAAMITFIIAPLTVWGVKNWVENSSLRQQAHDDSLKQDVLKEMKTVLADGLHTFAVNQTEMIRQNIQDNVTWEDLAEWVKETRVIERANGREHDFADPRDTREQMKSLRKQSSP